MQVTDEWAKSTWPEADGVLDARHRLQMKISRQVRGERADIVQSAILEELVNCVEADLGEDYVRDYACGLYVQELVDLHAKACPLPLLASYTDPAYAP